MTNQVRFTASLQEGKVEWHDADGKPAKQHELHVPQGHPKHMIRFTIDDKTGLGLKLEEDQPLHAWEGNGCPPEGIDTDQLEVVRAGADSLEVLNRNSGRERRLQYQLNVIAADGTRCPCDPIINNGGGGTGTGS